MYGLFGGREGRLKLKLTLHSISDLSRIREWVRNPLSPKQREFSWPPITVFPNREHSLI